MPNTMSKDSRPEEVDIIKYRSCSRFKDWCFATVELDEDIQPQLSKSRKWSYIGLVVLFGVVAPVCIVSLALRRSLFAQPPAKTYFSALRTEYPMP